MATGHLSRKQLQRDEVIETAKTGIEWFKAYEREIIRWGIVVVAALVVGGGVWGFFAFRAHRVSTLVSTALEDLARPDATPEAKAAARKLLDQAAERYPSTALGRAATLVDAGRKATDGDVAAAWDATLKVADAARNQGLVDTWAEYDLILLAPAAGKTADEISRLDAELQKEKPALPKDLLLFSLGDLHERAGQKLEAETAYRRLMTEAPDSTLRSKAQQKLDSLTG